MPGQRASATNPLRKKLVQLVHIGKGKLRLDDETYRDMLQAHGGAGSTSDMTVAQLERVLAHLRSCGFTPARASQNKAGKQRPPHTLGKGDKGDLTKKIEALLTDAGLPGLTRWRWPSACTGRIASSSATARNWPASSPPWIVLRSSAWCRC